ncbi:MAG: type II secretion system F family protein [Fimbriiglobus sp.]
MQLLAFISAQTLTPILVFVAIMAGTFWLLSLISARNSQAEDRLERMGRPKSLVDIDMSQQESRTRFAGLRKAMSNLGAAMEPKSDLEKNSLRVTLSNAGFRSEQAPTIYQGLRLASTLITFVPALIYFGFVEGFPTDGLIKMVFCASVGFYVPQVVLWYLRTSRQQEIFLTLPDTLDLLVVCVESGLGLDAALRKVTDEMKAHAKVMSEELTLANLQLQMGRPRREVLHDLGVRTGVDDVKALAAILIQADRFGSSIANALRVQSDSMRTRRRQIAEEKAAKTAVQLIFPLVLFIFPAIFTVLVGPAAIMIVQTLVK